MRVFVPKVTVTENVPEIIAEARAMVVSFRLINHYLFHSNVECTVSESCAFAMFDVTLCIPKNTAELVHLPGASLQR